MLGSISKALLALSLVSASTALSTDIETGVQPGLDLSVLTRHQSPPNPPQFRLPPVLDISWNKPWDRTPGYWFLGTWYMTQSSYVNYKAWRNIQWTISPTANNTVDDTLQDLTTFQWLNETLGDTVWPLWGIDTRLEINGTEAVDAYHYVPTGPMAFANNTYSTIAWGYGEFGVPFLVVYEEYLGSGWLDIFSRSDKGPSNRTLDAIYEGIQSLGSDALNTLVPQVAKLVQDGSRDGLPYPTCNATCQTNVNNPYGY